MDPASDIQSTVTRLLQHTKQLLESLTLWSRGQAAEDDVSDVYVQLGNEFNLACRKFLAAGVEVADLGDVPHMLRIILERALAEDASESSLDQYLPQIREIIVNLLRQLKHKQTLLRQNQMRHMTGSISGGAHSRSASRASTGQMSVSSIEFGTPKSSNQRFDEIHGAQSSASEGATKNSSNVPPMSRQIRATASPRPGGPPATSVPGTASTAYPRPTRRDPQQVPKNRSPLAQLQRHGALERAASKRFSSHHLSRMMNGVGAEQTLLPTVAPQRTAPADYVDSAVHRDSGDGRDHRESREGLEPPATALQDVPEVPPVPPNPSLARRESVQRHKSSAGASSSWDSPRNSPRPPAPSDSPSPKNSPFASPQPQTKSDITPATPRLSKGRVNDEMVVFLRMGDRIRKTFVTTPPTLPAIRLKFVDMFEYMPSADSVFPEMAIQDSKTGIDYELTPATLPDVVEGTLLSLKVEPEIPAGVEARLDSLQKTLMEIVNHPVEGRRPSLPHNRDRTPTPISGTRPDNDKSLVRKKSTDERRINGDQAEVLRKEVAVIRQLSSRLVSAMRAEIALLQSEVSELRHAQVGGVSRSYMKATKTKLDEDNQKLLSLVDDLQDVIDAQRVAAVQRGILPTPKQLETVRRDLAGANERLTALQGFVTGEEPTWRRTWEAELNTVIEEQKWVTLQKDILGDLSADIQRAAETFELVEQVAVDPATVTSRSRSVPHIEPIPPGQEQEVASAVLSEISALQPNHEQRLEAAKRMERLRERELALRSSQFEEELGTFVGDNLLRQTGGIEEVERRRRERDAAVREQQKIHDAEAADLREKMREERRKQRQAGSSEPNEP